MGSSTSSVIMKGSMSLSMMPVTSASRKSSSGFHQWIAEDPKQQGIYSNYHLWQKQIYFEGIETGSEYIVLRYLAESSGRLLMALFLASKCEGGVQEDCIYFMHRFIDNPSREYVGPCLNPLGDSGMYNMRDGKIKPLLPEVLMGELRSKQQFLTWFFPADA